MGKQNSKPESDDIHRFAMIMWMLAVAVVILLVMCGRGHAETKIVWSSFSSGTCTQSDKGTNVVSMLGGSFVGGYDDSSGAGNPYALLPVELTSFSATSQRLNAKLQWKTATEVNNYGFEIERRRIQTTASSSQKEGAEWTRSGFVEGAGTSNTPREYTFTDKNLAASKYEFRLKQIDRNGNFHYSQSVEVEVGVAPKVFELSQNYPNPFNPSTTIEYGLPSASKVRLTILDVLGRNVATLYNGEQEAGYQRLRWDAPVSTGVYFYRIDATSLQNPERRFVQVKKMLMIK